MSDAQQDPAELQKRLWKEIGDAKFGMLGLVGGEPHHMQPMTAFADAEAHAIWFYTSKGTDLFKDTGAGHDAMLCIMAKDDEFQACLHGELMPSHDQAKIDEYWSPFVSAWFPEGKSDPNLTMMKLELKDARVWTAKRGPFRYPIEIAKANATHTLPDVGGKADLRL
jgi:general stress protein 26